MAIAFDAVSNVSDVTDIAAPIEMSWSHTCSTGSDRLLLVAFHGPDAGDTVASVTYAGTSMTLVRETVNAGANLVSVWELVAPATGANTILVTVNNAFTSAEGSAISFTGVDQTTPTEADNGSTADAAGAVSTAVTTLTDNAWGVDFCTKEASSNGMVVDTGQTSRVDIDASTLDYGISTEGPVTPAGSVTMGWNDDGSIFNFDWAHVIVAIKPSGAAAATLVPRRMIMGIGI